jgi:cytochrome b561
VPHAETTHYDASSRLLHWITAVVVTVAFILGPEHFGRLMRDGVDPATRNDIVWHESLGILVFVLTAARLMWVALRPAPPRFAMAAWMAIAAKVIHIVLWALLLLLPITAILTLGGEGHPLTVLGGLRIDRMPIIADSAVAKLADWGEVHGFLGNTLIWLAGVHACVAVVHHVALKDGVLAAMLPPRKMR